MGGPPLGFPRGPEDLVDDAGKPIRTTRPFPGRPLACHGMMHTVITNAHKGDPYPVDALRVHGEHGWNSAMNTKETIDMLTDNAKTGSTRSEDHLLDAYFSKLCPMPT